MTLETNNRILIHIYTLLKHKIDFRLSTNTDKKIEKGIKPIEDLINQTQDEEVIAQYHYELAFLYKALNRKEECLDHKNIATRIFTKYNDKNPFIEYIVRLSDLKKM